ncbi:hypothetical protein PG988_003604 [Apiospora saccharicola]
MKPSSSTLSVSPEDFDENGDWTPKDWTTSADEPITDEVDELDPPVCQDDGTLDGIIKRNDAAALEEHLQKFHHRRVMPRMRDSAPWHAAIQGGKLEALRVLVEYVDYDYPHREWCAVETAATLSGCCFDSRYLLHYACRFARQLPIVRFLLERAETADLGRRTADGYTPFLLACEALCERSPRDELSLEEHVAHCETVIGLLLDLGADANDQLIQDGVVVATPLSFAATLGTPEMMQRLIDQGADVTVRVHFEANYAEWYEVEYYGGIGNSTPLHLAARYLNVQVVRALLGQPEGPAMSLARDDEGRQPLHCLASESPMGLQRHLALRRWQDRWEGRYGDLLQAARSRFAARAIETAQALLPYSNLEAPGPDGKTPFFVAAEYCDTAVNHESKAVRWYEVLHFLLDQGANPAVTDYNGNAALGRLVRARLWDPPVGFLERFVRLDTSAVTAADAKGNTPLHHALWLVEKVDTVRFLLDHGAEPNAANDEGDTPVHVILGNLRGLIEDFFALRDDSSENEKREHQRKKDRIEAVKEILEMLLGPDADLAVVLDLPNRAGQTPRDMIRDVERAEEWRRNTDAGYHD